MLSHMHPFTTPPELARTFQAERAADVRRAMTAAPWRRPKIRFVTQRVDRSTWRAWRLRATMRGWRHAGRLIGRPGRWVWDWRA
jgi:hypothetical protein